MMQTVMRVFYGLLLGLCLLFPSPGGAAEVELLGAGATFPQPFYHEMFTAYSRQTGVSIRYEGIGSGSGIERIIGRKADFAGTDAFMSDQEVKAAGAPVIHIPTCLGAVVLVYNLPGNPQLRLTGDLIAGIYSGKVTKWNDPQIAAVNPGVKLPEMPIMGVRRSDASGTTYILSEYLSQVSTEWKEKIGTGKSLRWPTSLKQAKGNPGVAGLVRQITGSAGYVELTYALANDMTFASIRNRAGRFIVPTPESVSLAATVSLPEDTNISLTDTPAPQGYPISSFTWLVLYREQGYDGRSREKAEALAKLLWWVVHDGQPYAKLLHYAPLPETAIGKAEALLRTLTHRDSKLLR